MKFGIGAFSFCVVRGWASAFFPLAYDIDFGWVAPRDGLAVIGFCSFPGYFYFFDLPARGWFDRFFAAAGSPPTVINPRVGARLEWSAVSFAPFFKLIEFPAGKNLRVACSSRFRTIRAVVQRHEPAEGRCIFLRITDVDGDRFLFSCNLRVLTDYFF